jgi:hypothetical protein
VNRDYDGRQYVGICTGAAVCFAVWVPKLNGQEDNIDESTHAISDARVTHREEIGFSYFVFGASVSDALVPVVAKLAGI